MRVTIQDIADALGISRNTVSKALNQAEGIADATREKILQKAIEMGYKQFSYVSTLSKVSNQIHDPLSAPAGEIALFTTTLFQQHHHFGIIMLDRFKQELSQLGYTLDTHKVEPENLIHHTLPSTFVKEQVSAIICVEMLDRDYDEMICGLGLPVLFVDGPSTRLGNPLPADQLYMDNTSGITTIVNDMLARGKQKIGFIGDYEHCQSFYERYAAFRLAMLFAGVPVEEKFCLTTNSKEKLYELLNALTELPDLFICANDFIAVEAIETLRKRGKTVPKDILFAGFDDAPESRIITPPLTTIHIHTQTMAFTAAQLLISRIKEPSLDYRVVHTETTLIYRDSTVPPNIGS